MDLWVAEKPPYGRSILNIYYIQAEEITWDYFHGESSATNQFDDQLKPYNLTATFDANDVVDNTLLNNQLWNETYSNYTSNSSYTKCVLKYYTDKNYNVSLYTNEEELKSYGILGGIIRAEVGDTLEIWFKNTCNQPLSLHAHGLTPAKASEGFKTYDNHQGINKGNYVLPNEKFMYIWPISLESANVVQDHVQQEPMFYLIESQTNSSSNLNSGIITGLIIYPEDYTNLNYYPTNQINEQILYFGIFDEDNSYYNDDDQSTTSFYTINGYIYGNLPTIKVYNDQSTHFYLASLSTTEEIFTIQIDQMDSIISLTNGVSQVITLNNLSSGMYQIKSNILSHIKKGMFANYQVIDRLSSLSNNFSNNPTTTRTYYIGIKKINWNYSPHLTNNDFIANFSLEDHQYVIKTDTLLGMNYTKAKYIQYTDDTFTEIIEDNDDNSLLGPLLHVRSDELLQIYIKNIDVEFNANLFIDGITPNHSFHANNTNGLAIGESKIYQYYIHNQYNQTIYPYYCNSLDSLSYAIDTGLYGAIIISNKQKSDANTAKPLDIDREFIVAMNIYNEMNSYYFNNTIANSIQQNTTFIQNTYKRTINGYMYGYNQFNMIQGERIRWYILSAATNAYDQSISFTESNSIAISTGNTYVYDMNVTQVGTFLIRSNILSFYDAGMYDYYIVNSTDHVNNNVITTTSNSNSKKFDIFIQAEEIDWCYNIEKFAYFDNITITNVNQTNLYKKITLIEYTDHTFTIKKSISSSWLHKGFIGPILKINYGDVLQIYFSNKASIPLNLYMDGITQDIPTIINTNEITNYIWDSKYIKHFNHENSIIKGFYSNVNINKDINTGVFGAVIINKSDKNDRNLPPNGIDKEFVLMLNPINEKLSHFYTLNNDDDDLLTFHHVNGYIYGANVYNNDTSPFQMNEYDTIRWYILALPGIQQQAKSIKFNGHTAYIEQTQRISSIDISVGIYKSIDMNALNPGKWLSYNNAANIFNLGQYFYFIVHPKKIP